MIQKAKRQTVIYQDRQSLHNRFELEATLKDVSEFILKHNAELIELSFKRSDGFFDIIATVATYDKNGVEI